MKIDNFEELRNIIRYIFSNRETLYGVVAFGAAYWFMEAFFPKSMTKWSETSISLIAGFLGIAVSIAMLAGGVTDRILARTRTKVSKPPGHLLGRILSLLPKSYAEELGQGLSDYRIEYFEAEEDSNLWRCRILTLLFYWDLLKQPIYRMWYSILGSLKLFFSISGS